MIRFLAFLLFFLMALPAHAATLHEQEVIDFVASQVALRYQVARSQVDIHWRGADLASMEGVLPDGKVTMAIQGIPRLLGWATVPISLSVGGKFIRNIYPQMVIKVWQKVWITKVPIHRGDVLQADEVVPGKQSLDRVMGTPVLSLSTLAGAHARSEMPAGSVLVSEMFELPPLVHSGQLVTVRLTSGGLTIMTRGEVVGDGTMGQLVRVINPDTHRNYVARVVGEGEVEVSLEETP